MSLLVDRIAPNSSSTTAREGKSATNVVEEVEVFANSEDRKFAIVTFENVARFHLKTMRIPDWEKMKSAVSRSVFSSLVKLMGTFSGVWKSGAFLSDFTLSMSRSRGSD